MPADTSTLCAGSRAGSSSNTPSPCHVQRTPEGAVPAFVAGRLPSSVKARKSSSRDESALEVIDGTESEDGRQFVERRARFREQLRIGEIGGRKPVAIVSVDPRIELGE